LQSFTPLLFLLALIGGAAIGWILRTRRAGAEKAAISDGWQTQMDAARKENGRLAEQNKGLMEQVSQAQAAARDAARRSRELEQSLDEARAARDELTQDIRAVRNNLEHMLTEKQRLASEVSARTADHASTSALLERKDRRIAELKLELGKWQQRVPPLVEHFRAKSAEVSRLESELAEAGERIEGLEAMLGSEQTRVLPFSGAAAGDALAAAHASNEAVIDIEPAVTPLNGSMDTDIEAPFRLERDDLKKIKGIGPAIEKTLNELGIVRLAQIAAMQSYDIERIARHLKGFQKRIEREDWIGQAEALVSPDT